VSQGYVSLLERGKRSVPRGLAARLARLLDLSAGRSRDLFARSLDAARAAAALGRLGHPGFAHLRSRRTLAPEEVLVGTLLSDRADARVLEALPWLALTHPGLDWDWVVGQVKQHDQQNRLGFVLTVAAELARARADVTAAGGLTARAHRLERSRLAREDTLTGGTVTEAERLWLREHRSPEARRWNLLTSLSAATLRDAG